MTTLKMKDERFGVSAVIERMKEALEVATDADLAEALSTSRQNVSKWKSRKSIPYAEVVFVSLSRGVSLDYLLLGDAGARPGKQRRPANVDEQIIEAALTNLRASGLFYLPEEMEPLSTMAAIAKGVVFQYARAEEVMRELVTKKGLKPEDARQAAITATVLLSTDHTISGISRRLGLPTRKGPN